MQPTEPSVALTIANNLPAILTAAVPIVTALVSLIIAIISRKEAKEAKAANVTTSHEVAAVKSTTNRVIGVTKAMRDHITKDEVVSKSDNATIMKMGVQGIPEVPEPLQ